MAKKRIKRSYPEMFLDALKKASNGEQKLVPNGVLREKLGWEVDKYNRIKSQLLAENKIIVGKGFGGSVALDTPDTKLNVFVSYSHADEILKEELLKHLTPLKRINLIDEWHDRKLKPGDEWDKSISENLKSADIVLLLVSIDFINSKYCYDIELEKALELHDSKNTTVIPVILRSCIWHYTPFAKLQALPKDARAVSAWPDRDEALANVAEGVRQVAEQIRGLK